MSNRGTLFSSWEETFEVLETVCLTGAPCSHSERKLFQLPCQGHIIVISD